MSILILQQISSRTWKLKILSSKSEAWGITVFKYISRTKIWKESIQDTGFHRKLLDWCFSIITHLDMHFEEKSIKRTYTGKWILRMEFSIKLRFELNNPLKNRSTYHCILIIIRLINSRKVPHFLQCVLTFGSAALLLLSYISATNVLFMNIWDTLLFLG